MQAIWRRIEAWLAANTPAALGALNPPASEEAIARLERGLGVTLPGDFLASMRIHDGQTNLELFGPWGLLSSTRMLESWRSSEKVAKDVGYSWPVPTVGPVRPSWWVSAWIPFAENGSGDTLCLDLSPAEGGEHGRVVEYVHNFAERAVVSASFRAWLSAVADDFERGVYEADDLGFPRRAP